jgi:hypothetical protein
LLQSSRFTYSLLPMDMLISLAARSSTEAKGSKVVYIRRPLAPEHDLVTAWVARHFTPGWASETRTALSHQPCGVFIAIEPNTIVGFCCIDAIARGFVAALLRAALADMKAQGYAYAVAGAVGAPEFFRRVAGAVEIPGSSPGLYAGLLKG